MKNVRTVLLLYWQKHRRIITGFVIANQTTFVETRLDELNKERRVDLISADVPLEPISMSRLDRTNAL